MIFCLVFCYFLQNKVITSTSTSLSTSTSTKITTQLTKCDDGGVGPPKPVGTATKAKLFNLCFIALFFLHVHNYRTRKS